MPIALVSFGRHNLSNDLIHLQSWPLTWYEWFTYFIINPILYVLAILKNADLEKTSSKKVRLTLETKFDCDFTERRKEIDGMVMDYVNSIQNDDDSDQSSSEEEKAQKKVTPKKVAKKRKANSDSDASSNNDDSGDDYKPEKPAPKAKKSKKAEAGAKKKEKGTGRKGKSNQIIWFKWQSPNHTMSHTNRSNDTIFGAIRSLRFSQFCFFFFN